MLSDIEIAQATEPKHINDVAKIAGIPEEYIEQYGKYKAKIDLKFLEKSKKKNGKLILVTAMTPTSAGEGKTTTTIGLADGLRKIGKKSIVALREPSLGPVFGVKGGACGGGSTMFRSCRSFISTHRFQVIFCGSIPSSFPCLI